MSSQYNSTERIYSMNGASFELNGCTLVSPTPEDAALAKIGICCPDVFDLKDLVSWAFAHGYGSSCLTLTIAWNRSDVEEELERPMSDEEWQAAQAWLDATNGGFAAHNVYRAQEDIQMELARFVNNGDILDYRE